MKSRNSIVLGTVIMALSWVCAGQTLDPWKIYDKLDPDIYRTRGGLFCQPTVKVYETIICVTNYEQYPVIGTNEAPPPAPRPAAADVLSSYLKSFDTNAAARAAAQDVIQSAQVIFLHYEHNVPMEDSSKASAFALSIKASHVVPIANHAADGKTYPQIDLVFSKLFSMNQGVPPEQWLEEMRRPLAAGFTLGPVTVIKIPTARIMEKSSPAVQAASRDFAAELLKMKPDSPQLASFDGTSSPTGLRYEQGLGKASKAGQERLRDDWCAISLWMAPVTGNPRQQPVPTKLYPRQAIEVCWVVRSADQKLNDRIIAAINTVLKKMDAVEAEVGKESEAAPADP